jgi:hypothetical protein
MTAIRPPPSTTSNRSVIPDSPPGSRLAVLLERLPEGHRIDDQSFALRHRFAVFCSIGLFLLLLAIGSAGDDSVARTLLELSPMAFAIVVGARVSSRAVATFSVAFALMAASSLLVHFTDGQIESHFLFFVLLPLVALYQDWRLFRF